MNWRAIGTALAVAAPASMAVAAAPAPLNRYGFADLPVPGPVEATLALFAVAAAFATIGLWLGHWRSSGKAGGRSLAALAALPLYVCAWQSLPSTVSAGPFWLAGIGYGLAAMGFIAGLALGGGNARAAWLLFGGAIAAMMLYVVHEWMPPLALGLAFAGLALAHRGTARGLFPALAAPPLLLMIAGERGTWLAY